MFQYELGSIPFSVFRREYVELGLFIFKCLVEYSSDIIRDQKFLFSLWKALNCVFNLLIFSGFPVVFSLICDFIIVTFFLLAYRLILFSF